MLESCSQPPGRRHVQRRLRCALKQSTHNALELRKSPALIHLMTVRRVMPHLRVPGIPHRARLGIEPDHATGTARKTFLLRGAWRLRVLSRFLSAESTSPVPVRVSCIPGRRNLRAIRIRNSIQWRLWLASSDNRSNSANQIDLVACGTKLSWLNESPQLAC